MKHSPASTITFNAKAIDSKANPQTLSMPITKTQRKELFSVMGVLDDKASTSNGVLSIQPTKPIYINPPYKTHN